MVPVRRYDLTHPGLRDGIIVNARAGSRPRFESRPRRNDTATLTSAVYGSVAPGCDVSAGGPSCAFVDLFLTCAGVWRQP